MKSPLRYPGGKSRAIATLMEFIPDDCGELCSPFLGGGSFELALASKGVSIHGYEAFKPLVWLWHALVHEPDRLASWADLYRAVHTYKYTKPHAEKAQKIVARGLPKGDFERFRDEIRFAVENNHSYSIEAAAKVYAINRSSFSGATFAGGFSERASYARFTDSQIEYVRNFKVDNFSVKYADFKDSMKKHDCLFYLDPPYFLEGTRNKLYGDAGSMHECFPHLDLFATLRQRDNWVLSYNDCEEIRHLYQDYKIHEAAWTYGMNKSKKSSEIIITNLPNATHSVIIEPEGEPNG